MKKMKYLGLLLASAGLFACTSHDNDLYNVTTASELRVAQYKAAFVQTFGSIDPAHTWGFGTTTTKAETRGANANANEWYKTWIIPELPTDAEKATVAKWFATHQYPESVSLSYNDYFIMQVSRGDKIYKDGNGNEVNASDKMNRLVDGTGVHINDGNSANITGVTLYYDNSTKQENAGIMLMNDGNTAQFGYSNSLDSGNTYYDFVICQINGAYYIGFDFKAEGQNPNQQVAADGFYDDWILKIVPAMPVNTQRIFAEDLGTIGDFDLNDVVFDAGTVNGTAYITLRAAGGTLPIYIGGQSAANEIHGRFGVSTSEPVNVAPGQHTAVPAVQYKLSGSFSEIIDIPITIVNGEMTYTLEAKTGEAPGKLASPYGTDWSDEGQNIKTKYASFASYVARSTVEWWN